MSEAVLQRTPIAQAIATSEPPVGARLCGRYRVLAPVARGGSSVVLRALDELLDLTVALKVLLPGPSGVIGLQKEALAAMRLSHPSIVRVYNYERHPPWEMLVMECVEGGNLGQRLAALPEHRLTPAETVALGLDCLAALAYAHRQGVIHNDLKPTNILTPAAGGPPRLCDFGLAAPRASADVVGTPAYMSPERICGASGDARSDLYSLAATLYAVGNGRPMFGGSDVVQLRAHLRLPPPPSPHLPPHLHAWLRRAAAKEPEARFQSADEMREALLEVGRGLEPLVATPRPLVDDAQEPPELTIEYDGTPSASMVPIDGRRLESHWGGSFVVPPFWLDATPVTNLDYATFVQATGAAAPDHWRCQRPHPRELDHPVTWVSLGDARRYAAWRGCRLPTQLEWEAAARGPRGWRFPWGDDWEPERVHGPGATGTAPVTTHVAGASLEGCLDLVGNVWEWTEPEARVPMPSDGQAWVYGGSYRDVAPRDGSFPRARVGSGKGYGHLGFRCARDRRSP